MPEACRIGSVSPRSYFMPFRDESPARAKGCLTVAVCAVIAGCALVDSEQTIFDLSTYPQQYQGKTVKVKCQTISSGFAGAFFCDDGTSGGDAVEIDPDSVDKDSLRYLKTRCNEPVAQCRGSVTGKFEANEFGDLYIRDATFNFTKGK